jgi:hypothetical protein
MALAHFQRTFTDTQGNVKPGLAVTVRRESDNGLAALFADAGSVTAKSNPFNTDANGYGSFYVTDGRYRIQATDIDWRDTDIFISPTFYAQLAGGPLANFTAIPQVGGDPIVESGSNADGEWTRWSDGTQICKTITSLSHTSGSGRYEMTYPVNFSNLTSNFRVTAGSEDQGASFTRRYDVSSVSTSSSSSLLAYLGVSTISYRIRYMTIGRWK